MNQHSMAAVEIGPRELLVIFRRSRVLILALTCIGLCGGLAAALLTTKMYQATIMVSPVADESSGGRLSSLVSQMGGLASLSGLAGLPSAGNTQKSEIVATLQSEAITERYITDNDLLPVLFPDKWDFERKAWTTSNATKIPTLWKANILFKKKIRFVTTDTKSGLVTMVITWSDPALAARWANGLVKLTNDYLREKTIGDAERNIAYLGEQASKTDVLGVKEAIYSILQNEIKKMMLARGSAEYALKTIDPAFAPERPSSPQPVLWTVMGLFAGLFASLLIVFTKHWWAM